MERNELVMLWVALREAKKGDRSLDERVWKACGGSIITRPLNVRQTYHVYIDAMGMHWRERDTHVTTDIQCAIDLLPNDYDWIVSHTNGGLTKHAKVGPNPEVFGDTVPLAICIANLEARHPWLIERTTQTPTKG